MSGIMSRLITADDDQLISLKREFSLHRPASCSSAITSPALLLLLAACGGGGGGSASAVRPVLTSNEVRDIQSGSKGIQDVFSPNQVGVALVLVRSGEVVVTVPNGKEILDDATDSTNLNRSFVFPDGRIRFEKTRFKFDFKDGNPANDDEISGTVLEGAGAGTKFRVVLGGDDARLFKFTDVGEFFGIAFRSPMDSSAPRDIGADNEYDLKLR